MKKLILLLLFIPLVSCSSDEDGDMKLKIINNFSDSKVTRVNLQDYDFQNLSINSGNNRTFILNNGIPTGGSDIEVRIFVDCVLESYQKTIRVDFIDGHTTTIEIRERPNKPLENANCHWFDLVN